MRVAFVDGRKADKRLARRVLLVLSRRLLWIFGWCVSSPAMAIRGGVDERGASPPVSFACEAAWNGERRPLQVGAELSMEAQRQVARLLQSSSQ